MEINKIYPGDCIEVLKTIPDNSIDCCVTSPPYFGLRDYGNSDQIGLEETPELYVAKIVEVFTEVKRVLKKEGTLWLNLGDSYAGSYRGTNENGKQGTNKGTIFNPETSDKRYGLKPKDLFGIPWMVAFALRSSGWYLRQDIIWHKPNPMPESVTDRCTKSHEYIFLISKSAKYYYDAEAIKTKVKDSTVQRMAQQIEDQKGSNRVSGKTNGNMKAVASNRKYSDYKGSAFSKVSGGFYENGEIVGNGMANKKSVWTISTMPYSEAHFATFPERLIIDCIKAGCPEFVCKKCGKARERIVENEYIVHENWYGDKTKKSKNSRGKAGSSYKEKVKINDVGFNDCGCNAGFSLGIVLDPFMGAGTTALVARKLNRNFIGIELNEEYIKIAQKRLKDHLGMFL